MDFWLGVTAEPFVKNETISFLLSSSSFSNGFVPEFKTYIRRTNYKLQNRRNKTK